MGLGVYGSNMAQDLTETFAALEEGDKIQTDLMQNPLEVTEVHESVGTVELEGQRGGSKSLVQNKHNPEDIAMLRGGDRKGFLSELERL